MSLSHSPTFRLANPDDLQLLWTRTRSGRRLVLGRIAVQLPGLSQEERDGFEQRINKAYFDCGCVEAAILGFAGLAAYLVWAAGASDTSLWLKLPGAALIFFLAVGVGKVIGRLRATRALRDELSKLARACRITLGRENETEGAACAVGGDLTASDMLSRGRAS